MINIAFSILVFSTNGFADPVALKVGEVFVTEYVKSQAQERVKEFLNSNPEYLLSTSPTIGTDAMQFLGKNLAMAGFVFAKTDKQRLFAGINLVLAPDPVTSMVLIGVQLVDMVLSLQNAKEIARIRENIKRLQVETEKFKRDTFFNEIREPIFIVETLHEEIAIILAIQERLNSDPVVNYIQENSDRTPTEVETEILFTELSNLYRSLENFNIQYFMFQKTVDIQKLRLAASEVENITNFSKLTAPMADSLEEIRESVRLMFALYRKEKHLDRIEASAQHQIDANRIYLRCVEAFNSPSKNSDKINFDLESLIYDCNEKFLLEVEDAA